MHTEKVSRPIVIVGSGLAGLRAAEAARAAGYAGRIVLVGEEPHEPYDRPPLSKDVLLTPGRENDIRLTESRSLDELSIERMFGVRVVSIDPASQTVELNDRSPLPYSKLILATGSSVRPLPQLPPGAPGVHYLRTMEDAVALRAAMKTSQRIAVIGGGVIGLEVAAAATAMGASVVVVEAGPRVMGRSAAPAISDFLQKAHESRGVEIRTGCSIEHVERIDGALSLTCADGCKITTDIVVVGIGVTPNSELAASCGLDVAPQGVVVDGWGQTSDPAIFAAGECAFHFNAASGEQERQETWAHAAAHGEHVGRAVVLGVDALPPYAETMSYWSDQFDISLQCVGDCATDDHVLRGDMKSERFTIFHLSDGVVVGASCVNSARDIRVAKSLISSGARVSRDQLSDLTVNLRTVATAA